MPSIASATLFAFTSVNEIPVPSIIKVIALPEFHPFLPTIASTKVDKLGVLWSAPESPIVHASGDQLTVDDVNVFFEDALKLSDASKSSEWSLFSIEIINSQLSELDSSAVNWIYALSIVAPWGIVMLLNRKPMVWFPWLSKLSYTISKSEESV